MIELADLPLQLLTSASILSFTVPALLLAGSGACATQTGSGAVQPFNSWVVDGDQVVENRTIQLNGTLDIRRGTLTLRNVALEIDATQSSNWFPEAVVAINSGPGAGLVISNSRIEGYSPAIIVLVWEMPILSPRKQWWEPRMPCRQRPA